MNSFDRQETPLDSPFTALTVGGCVLWWFYCWNYDIDLSKVSYSYKQEKQFWRALTASYSHASLMHIGFNMISLWDTAFIEIRIGSLEYLKLTYLLLVGSILVITGVSHVLIRYMDRGQYREQSSVGYSAVLFGWMALISLENPLMVSKFMGILPMPSILRPFASLLFIQVLVPRASFIGHMGGIAIGFAVGLGCFYWFTDYLFLCTLFWSIVFLVYNLKMYSQLSMPCISMDSSNVSIINGNIVVSRLDDTNV